MGRMVKCESMDVNQPSQCEPKKELKILTKQIKNLITGITQGFSINLELKGIGYQAQLEDALSAPPIKSMNQAFVPLRHQSEGTGMDVLSHSVSQAI